MDRGGGRTFFSGGNYGWAGGLYKGKAAQAGAFEAGFRGVPLKNRHGAYHKGQSVPAVGGAATRLAQGLCAVPGFNGGARD